MISLSNLTLMRGARVLLEQANAVIYPKHKVGIIGRNGCGKSSLFALLTKEIAPEAGTLAMPQHLVIAKVNQQTPALDRSALDYVIDGDHELRALQQAHAAAMEKGDGNQIALLEDKLGIAGAWTINSRAGILLHGLGFAQEDLKRAVREFSGGWRMRLNLAQALIARSDLLLLDEPTNHLDLDTVMFLEDYLKQYQGTLMCISHDRDFLDVFCTDILHFESGKTVMYSGNYSAYEKIRAERIKNEKASRAKEEAILKHMQDFVERFRYKASKAKQAQSRLKAMEKMQLTAVTQEESPYSFSFPEPSRTPQVIAAIDDLDAGYGTHKVLQHVNLQLLAGDRIALLGRNGKGKSTFIKTLCAELAPLHGSIKLGQGIKIGYFAQQELEALDQDASVLDHLQRLDPKARERDLRTFLGGFAFSGDKVLMQVRDLSGGEQARLALAMIAFQKPNLLLLDEPTNHLDLDMREALTVALAAYPGALLLVTHDTHLLSAIADKLWIADEGTIKEFDGSLEDYRERLLKQNREFKNAAPSTSVTAKQQREDKRKAAAFRQSLRPLKLQISKLESSMDQLKQQLQQLDEKLADSSLYQGKGNEIEQLMKDRAAAQDAMDEAETQWLELQEQLENKIQEHARTC